MFYLASVIAVSSAQVNRPGATIAGSVDRYPSHLRGTYLDWKSPLRSACYHSLYMYGSKYSYVIDCTYTGKYAVQSADQPVVKDRCLVGEV